MPSYPGFLGGSYKGASYMAGVEVCKNWYPERTETADAVVPQSLLPCPGVTPFATQAASPGRAAWSENGRNFYVGGNLFYEFTAAGNLIEWAVVANDGTPATISAGAGQLFITAGGIGYSFNLQTNVMQVVVASGCNFGGFVDAFFLYLDVLTSTIYASAPKDSTSWPALSLAQRSTGSDPWLAMYVVDRLVYLLGQKTSDIYYDAGSFPFPLAPILEAFMQTGIEAPFSGARFGQSLAWLARSEQGRGWVVATNGYVPQRISIEGIESTIASYATRMDALGMTYADGGHTFYVLTFPTGNQTFVFDQLTGLWHERAYWNTAMATWQAWRPMWAAALPTQTIVADRLTGSLYTLTTTSGLDVDGSLIRRERQPPRLHADGRRFTLNRLEVFLDVAQGLPVGQGRQPTMMLRSSRDAGQTFGNEFWRSAGAQGQTLTRVFWTNLGQQRQYVPKFVVSDPVPWRIVDCQILVTPGIS